MTDLLEVAAIETSYGLSRVLFGISLAVAPGEMVSLMGRNGMGKTTTVRSIMGLTPASAGSIRFAGVEIRGLPPFRIAKLGIGLVPEGRQVFPNLTARENLVATAANRSGSAEPWTFARVCALFPHLAARLDSRANLLSGGEQQMLAIGRILRTGANLLMLDEPTEGLAPVIVQLIGRTIQGLKAKGFTILLVEQNFRFAATVADRHYVMERGRVVDMIPNTELDARMDKLHEYLGV